MHRVVNWTVLFYRKCSCGSCVTRLKNALVAISYCWQQADVRAHTLPFFFDSWVLSSINMKEAYKEIICVLTRFTTKHIPMYPTNSIRH